jgi:hypothetical protein
MPSKFCSSMTLAHRIYLTDERLLVRTFSEWTNGRGEKCLSTFPLSHLKDAAIGIDASYYLDLHLHRDASKENLLTALGGFPFALKASVERDLQELKQLGITAVFVFPGLDFGKKEFVYDPQSAEALQNDRAWELYDQGLGEKVVEAFGKAGMNRHARFVDFLTVYHRYCKARVPTSTSPEDIAGLPCGVHGRALQCLGSGKCPLELDL